MGKHLVMLLALLLQLLCGCAGNRRMPRAASMQFTQPVYNTTIYENSAAKTYLESHTKMGVYVSDPAWEVRYKIISGDNENLFKAEDYLVGDFSFLRIRTKGGSTAILNREVKDHYVLTVKASERNTNVECRTRVKVQVLDTNDLRPLFSPTSYSVSLPENTALRTSVAKVTATDADIGTNGEYYYSFRGWTDMFAVHPTSGVVTLTGKLDFSETRLYELEILAVDRGMKLYGSSGFSSMAKLTVRVEQANEHAPAIAAVALVPSDADPDPTYVIVTVEDADHGPNGEIASLSIVAGDPLQQFKAVRSSPGSKEYRIKAVKDVDWDSQPFGYNLTLQAKDKGSPPQFSAVKLVHVTPALLRAGPPVFEKAVYRVNLSEFAPLHTPVTMVTAVPKHPQQKYAFKHKSDRNRFAINPDTGLISTAGPISADPSPQIELEVITADSKAETKVVIDVTDVNNNAPEFQQTSYKATIDENAPAGTSVLTVKASDRDRGENGYVTYSITNMSPQPFVIDYFTGLVTTSEVLDYELMPRIYNLKVRASDWGSPFRREVEASVTITLNNLNDNKPLFENVDCEVTVPRDHGVGEQIATVSAIDADELQLVRYRIKAGNELDAFELNPNSGVLSLRQTLQEGEAAKVSLHSLQVVATDGEYETRPMFMNITVLTARKPVQLKCVETGVASMLAEKLLQGSKIHTQTEPDDNLMDLHSVNRYAPQFAEAFPGLIEVKEDLLVGARIVHLSATDSDSGFNGKLVYVISGGNTGSHFVVDMETGWLQVYAPLDRETADSYTLNVTVYDLGIPQKSSSRLLGVKILDANDNSPQFLQESYSVQISEGTSVGTEIIQVDATDRDQGDNGVVKYSILGGTDDFAIDEDTGVVSVTKPLDRELHPVYVLKIAARDQAANEPQLVSTVPLRITLEDVNDNPPKFVPPNYRVKVREDLPVGTVIMWLEAHDPDLGASSQVRYSLIDNGDGHFEVDKLSGALRIVQTLDYETKQVFNLTAKAKDKGKPMSLLSTCFIEVHVVDVNENLYRPLFRSFVEKGFIKEDALVGTPVMTVTAEDEDKGRDGEVRYSIRDGSGLGIFTIDEETGTIRTQELLDHETTPHYWLTVYAMDRGVVPLSAFVEVYVEVQDVNDNAPQTSEPVYYPSVMENSPKDVSIIQINAVDPDTKASDRLSYRITSGNPQGFFAVNTRTGLITTTSRKLDREQQDEHILEITVTDHGVPAKSTTVRVIVQVLDENDNRPLFLEKIYKIKLPERERPDRERERGVRRDPVYRVIASDRDRGPNAEISYSIEEGDDNGKFFIEPKTGLVSSKKVSSAGEYDILTIKAVDNGRPQKSSSCRLHIEWIPKPELPPDAAPLQFEESPFVFSVMESDPVAHMVGVVATEASDVPVWFEITDGIEDTEVFYLLQMACDSNCTAEGGNYDSRFDVGKASGTLIVAQPLDAEQRSHYNLTVEATDGTRTVSTQVLIRVIDTNNHRPQFSEKFYRVNVAEDKPPGTEVLQISASDRDEKNKLTFTLLSSTDPFSLRKFRLDPGTGTLYTAERLDHETMHRHILTVMVRDQDIPVKRNLVRVIVNVDDANDNAPWFVGTPFSGRVFESAAVGSAVLQVTARDKDRGANAEITYSLESGNFANAFAIDPVLGTITVAKELDRSSKAQYELTVKASDNGIPPLSTTAAVHIAVTVSDNAAPRFTEKEFSADVSESAHPGSFVSLLTASSQSSVFYQIKGGNINNAFDINPNSGVVVTQRALDYESTAQYTLVIQATNMAGLGTNTTLLVHLKDENDNAPIFTQEEFRGVVSESAPVNSVVLTPENTPLVIRASDADGDRNAMLVYQIVEPFAHNYFAIDSNTGAIRITTALDYEERNAFHFTVQVHDLGMPRLFAETAANVTVEVADVNDCPPVFSQKIYEATVITPTYKGVEVIQINATDSDSGPNAKLLLSISEGNIGDKFRMEPTTGMISVQNVTQLRSRYELKVRVSDGRFSSVATVKINVKENKESKLKFTREFYKAFVQENSSEKKTLEVIAAVGNQVNEPLFYKILNPDKKFEIGRTSGVVSTTGILFDRETQDTFEIVVEVTRDGQSEDGAHVLLTVTVEDANDNRPMFVNLPYHALVQMEAEEGHVIRQVTAVDRDVGQNAEIHYQLKEHQELFQISKSGEISLKKKLEKDLLNRDFVIVVVARDNGQPALSAEVEVPVTVVNKAMPVFEKAFYTIEIPENVQLHTPVLHVQANDSEGPRIVYTISEGDPLKQFAIDFNTGVIHVTQLLDFETHPAYKLSVRATDSLTGAHSEVFVDIILEDVNDNAPVFLSKVYHANVSEASVIGTRILQVNAQDSDTGSNQEVFFQLVEEKGRSSDFFAIDRNTGAISTAQLLDYEEIQQHTLRVRVVDGGVPALSSEVLVTIDVTDLNDNAPEFTQQTYTSTISELAPRGHFVTQVQASDADSSDRDNLLFFFTSGNEDLNFSIDKHMGAILISNHRRAHMQPFYNLSVSVSDGVFRSSAAVLVTVIGANFHSPTFLQTEYVVELAENSNVDTLVAEAKASDGDEGIYGQISYHIVNDFAKDKFSVNEHGEIFTLESLDRENNMEKVVPISLMARDGGGKVGFCVVSVILTDINDNAPQFRAADYKSTIASDAPRGTSVVRIAASDADEGSNADIEYSIEADVENVEENFEIHPTSGLIVTKESLIGLENELYAFFVRAKDTGNPPKDSVVQVYIRIVAPETPIPKFNEAQYRYTVAEDLPIGTEIDVIQAESEQPLIYSLVKGSTPESNVDEVFVVDRDSGALKLQKSLDHETTKWYQFLLHCQTKHENYDIVASAIVNIQVKDINDNKPVFESDPYKAVVVENLPSGTQVIQVRASDQDSGTNGQVVYSLDARQSSEEISELFTVNSETGWVTTLRELDREKTERYTIGVLASDQGDRVQHVTGTRVEVTVADVNDNPPRFTAEIYKGTVSEDDPPPSGVIAILSTTDDDSEDINRQVNYFITGGDPLGQFAIEHIQNEWKVFVRKPLDREEKDNYLLNITASDGIFTAKATVEVKVLDANDNSPQCEKALYSESVPENSPAGRLILQVSASDADIRSNAHISYELQGAGSELFTIDSDTGELKTLQPLDREEQAEHRFKVRAVDGGGRYCEADVHVAVEDVNDNPPQFSSDPYTVTVFENTEIGTYVAKLLANDVDVGPNSDIVYSLLDSADGSFSVDERTGVISLQRPLDRELQSAYELRAAAADRGSPRLSSLCQVLVSVLDINDNPPVFEHREYTASVSEDVSVGAQLLRVQAASRDSEANGEISYAIISGNEHGLFSVDPRTGDVFVIQPLDYEASHEYYITVEATDGGSPPLSDMATVNINLTDVNDNQPVFSQDVYTAVVSEDAELGKTLVTVNAEDLDGPSHSHVRYAIVDGNHGSPFTIDPARGELKVAQQLDRERTSGYTLTVVASDNGVPPLSSTAMINIDISDVNDNPPLFSQANYSLIIQENRPKGTSVLQLTVTDRDASHNGPPFTFAIVDGNEGDAFRISERGALVAVGALNRKAVEHYLLQAQVSDSGKPQLFSSAFISIRIIEESVYPPAILPLDIFVTTTADEYSGGVLGKIHATDQDVYDTLTYSLAPSSSSPSEESGALFSVSASDGKVIALRPLDVGHYPLNVTVTDGRFVAAADVTVHVRQASPQALRNSIAVRFANIAPEEFIGDYWRNFQRALRNIAGVRRNEVQLVSLQPSDQGDLDVLMTLERSGSPYQSQEVVFRKLNSSAGVIEEMTGVRIVRVVQKLCAGLDCPLRFCDETVTLDKSAMSTHSTARLSFVTPRHTRTATCQCEGGTCPVLNSVCEKSPCPEGMECVEDLREDEYTCVCPEGKKGKCSDGHSLTFSGSSFVKYHLLENENKELMKLSLRLRTFSSHATVMYAKGTDYSILEIVNGRLQYKFDCGSGPGLVSVHSAQVNDGEWHSVSLEVDGNYAKLVLDRVHAASGTAPGTLRTLNLDNRLYFGAHVRQHATPARHGRSLPVSNGLRGCLEAISLNGQELPLSARGHRAHAVLEDMVDVTPGCALAPAAQSCSSNPCSSGGSCTSLPNGGYFCKCPASFMGTHCEVSISPCASNPCLYGGTCVPRGDDFYCQCRGQYSGQRCQLGPYCRDNPCKNSGKCIDSLDGPVCECEPGFQGDRCLSDVDECVRNPCANGGQCQNTYGSYRCNCSAGFGGQACELHKEVSNEVVSTSWNIGLEEVIGIVVFVSSIFILVLLFIIIRKRACRGRSKASHNKPPGGSSAPHSFLQRPYFDSKLNKNIYSDVPPQVPVRPISYTPSIPSDSRNNLDRNSFEGSAIPEHPEFSTFNPDSVHGHRKTVAVCSVAPNLPPPPPSNSVSDSDSIQKPNWDYDYDAKVVDLDPCLSKKPLEDSACHPYNTRGSMSEVHSLSSFQSESCDDNESFLAHDLKNPKGYHWDTSDWMPSVQLPGIQEFPQYEVVETPAPLYSDPSAIDTDYYPGGFDIESDFPPPPEDFPASEDLPPPPLPEYGDTLRPRGRSGGPAASPDGSPGTRQRPALPQLYSLNKYLPQHSYASEGGEEGPEASAASAASALGSAGYRGGFPLGRGRDFDSLALDNMSMSLYTSTASCSDMSACCEESEVMISDYESGDEGQFERLVIPGLDSQQHTEV